MNKRRIFLACTDTPSWDDVHGKTCADYRKKYCFDNIAYVNGFLVNYPEQNCCGCGKVAKIGGILFKARKMYFFTNTFDRQKIKTKCQVHVFF